MGIFTCPADASCLLKNIFVQSSGDVTIRMVRRLPGELEREFVKFPFTGNSPRFGADWIYIPGGTDIQCQAKSVSGNVGLGCWFSVYILRTAADRSASMDWQLLPWERRLPVPAVLACVDPWEKLAELAL
jgi:hypothetical protein